MQPDKYPRYFYSNRWDGETTILCMTGAKSGYLRDVMTDKCTKSSWPDAHGIGTCLTFLRTNDWFEGSHYGPFGSELSWREYMMVKKVVARLTGVTNAA